MSTFLQDIRYATRQLARAPGFTAVAIITLALGIGANTALFTLVHAVLFRPLSGVTGAERLVWVAPVSARGGHPTNMSYLDYVDYRDHTNVFSELAALDQAQFSISSGGGGAPERVRGQIVSGNFFSVLGTNMALGRGFVAEEDRTPNTHPVVVISYDLWQRRFAGDRAVVGSTLVLNGGPFTIVGIAPEHFNGPDHGERRDVWVPTMMASRVYPMWPKMLTQRHSWWLKGIGRLKPGVAPTQADAAVATVAAQIAKADTAGHRNVTARTFAVRSGMTPGDQQDVFPITALASAVTLLVLIIACANVSNLLLGRAVARRREIGVRLSLGAGRLRLVRQLLTESLLLSLLASAAGVLIAIWATDLLASQIPVPLNVSTDRTVLAFALGAAAIAGMLFGLLPALHATRGDLAGALKSGPAGHDRHRARLQGAFVVAQISLSLVLLVTTGMFLRSLVKANRIDVGFEATTRVLALSFDLGLQGYSPERAETFVRTIDERARSLPGVSGVSFTNVVPLGERMMGADVTLESNKPREEAAFDPQRGMGTYEYTVRPGYFSTLGIPLLRGRDFAPADNANAPGVVVVSEQFARAAWGTDDPIGKRLSLGGPKGPYLTVIGVAREALLGGTTERNRPIVYAAQLQRPSVMDLTMLVRASGNAGPLAVALRREIATLDADLPVFGTQTLAQYRSDRLAESRLGSGLLGIFGSLALLLASVGVYAVIAFAVSQRRREIGVRVALGALQREVVSLFVRQGMRLTMTGVAVGLVLSIGVAKLLSSVFFGITADDVPTALGVASVLTTVALLACWLPARRAAKVDPMEALRHE